MKSPTAQSPRQSHDLGEIPFTVQGYVTDPKLIGYQILTNYENMYWRAFVGNDVWSLYEVLRGFCHEGKATCYPSVRLLMDVLGLKDRRRLTGRITKSKGLEYRYPGLLDKLQEAELVIVEVKGEEPTTQYLFHVNLTPSILNDDQLKELPSLLLERHQGLIEKCEQSLATLQAKKRPSKVKPKEGGGKLPGGGGKLPEGVANCQGGGGKLPPKQQQSNNTHITTPNNNNSNNNNGKSAEQDVVVALLHSHGISNNVAKKLTTQYEEALIREKIEFLDFLIAEERVKAPAGWLRKAIEEDYAAPDGYISKSEREEQERQAQKRQDEEAKRRSESNRIAAEMQEQEQKFKDEALRHIRSEYGTTDEDVDFGQKLQQELEMTNFSSMTLAGVRFLRLDGDTAVLGATNPFVFRQLQHPGTQTEIKRALKRLTKKQIDISLVQLELSPDSIPG